MIEFSTTTGRAHNGRYSVLIVATYTAKSGRKISSRGWTQATALRNLSRKVGVNVILSHKGGSQ